MCLTKIRNSIERAGYKLFAKPIFFKQDPEDVHDMMTKRGVFLGRHWLTRSITGLMFRYSNKMLEQDILGIHFKNPIGLSAGFDKNAQLTDILPEVGFGFAELGSITGEPCEGNPRPRLWRLPKSQSLVVFYGLKNDGCEAIAERLRKKTFKIAIGTSVAKTNNKETVDVDKGVADYVKAFKKTADIGDYTTINISCPNTFGGEPFTDPVKLEKLLSATDKVKISKPVFIKFSPDLSKKKLDSLLEVVKKHKIDGFVCTNLTKKRDNPKILDDNVPEKGGISGKAVQDLTDDQISYIYKKTKGKYVIMGVGGVSSAEDAYKKVKAGASLIQMITGMIYEGPQVISEINLGLVKLLKKDGFKNISEAIGKDNQ